jgi:hypothetical protein
MKRFLIWAGIVLVLMGCEATKSFREGHVYVVNNVGGRGNLPFYGVGVKFEDRYVIAEWEGERIKIHPNMHEDKSSTGVGAVRITSEPLAGGVVVDFVYCYCDGGNEERRKISHVLGERVIMDGDMTIELYSDHWDLVDHQIMVYPELHRGKFDGIHMY